MGIVFAGKSVGTRCNGDHALRWLTPRAFMAPTTTTTTTTTGTYLIRFSAQHPGFFTITTLTSRDNLQNYRVRCRALLSRPRAQTLIRPHALVTNARSHAPGKAYWLTEDKSFPSLRKLVKHYKAELGLKVPFRPRPIHTRAGCPERPDTPPLRGHLTATRPRSRVPSTVSCWCRSRRESGSTSTPTSPRPPVPARRPRLRCRCPSRRRKRKKGRRKERAPRRSTHPDTQRPR